MLSRIALALVLVSCAARARHTEELPDPVLVAVDRAWDTRSADGLDPVEDALLVAMDRPGAERDPEVVWRYARLLVHRGMVEEGDRRAALDRYAGARAQAMLCLDQSPAWQQRRGEAGLEAALAVVEEAQMPCLAWGTLAWARWVALMGGDAAALDLDDVAAMADRLARASDPDLVDIGGWARALVAASRPVDRAEDRGRKRLEGAIASRPNDLVRHWDLLTLVAEPSGDEALVARERKKILDGPARNPADRAARRRVKDATE